MNAKDIVTVATFATAVEADLARNVLAEEGVAAYLECGALVEMVWMLGNAVVCAAAGAFIAMLRS